MRLRACCPDACPSRTSPRSSGKRRPACGRLAVTGRGRRGTCRVGSAPRGARRARPHDGQLTARLRPNPSVIRQDNRRLPCPRAWAAGASVEKADSGGKTGPRPLCSWACWDALGAAGGRVSRALRASPCPLVSELSPTGPHGSVTPQRTLTGLRGSLVGLTGAGGPPGTASHREDRPLPSRQCPVPVLALLVSLLQTGPSGAPGSRVPEDTAAVARPQETAPASPTFIPAEPVGTQCAARSLR